MVQAGQAGTGQLRGRGHPVHVRPEGKSIVDLYRGMPGTTATQVPAGAKFVAFTAQTRMSGVDLPDGRDHPQGRLRFRGEACPSTRRDAAGALEGASGRGRFAGGHAAAGLGGVIVPFIGIKLIDMVLSVFL